jgi:hypothetical protein
MNRQGSEPPTPAIRDADSLFCLLLIGDPRPRAHQSDRRNGRAFSSHTAIGGGLPFGVNDIVSQLCVAHFAFSRD